MNFMCFSQIFKENPEKPGKWEGLYPAHEWGYRRNALRYDPNNKNQHDYVPGNQIIFKS